MNVCIWDQTECSVWDTPEGYLKVYTDVKEIAEGSGVLPAFPETKRLTPSTNNLKHQCQETSPSSGLCGHCKHGVHSHTCKQNSNMQAKQQYT